MAENKAETPMTELLADVGGENNETAEVILSKTEMQKKQSLKGVKFSDHQDTIEKINKADYLGIRITLKGELYGYDIPIPAEAKIYRDKTVVKAEKETMKVKIFKETEFNLKSTMMH